MTARPPEIEELVRLLNLQPLPVEGGVFKQTYRSEEVINPSALPGRYPSLPRAFGTAIQYLFTADADSFSALHWLPTDEIYHFYLGDPVEMLLLEPEGISRRVLLGQDLLNGQQVQYVVPRSVIQGSHLLPGGRYALVGTTMAPGFEESDYHGCERASLLAAYPDQAELILTLTRPGSPLEMPSSQGTAPYP